MERWVVARDTPGRQTSHGGFDARVFVLRIVLLLYGYQVAAHDKNT